MEQGNLDKLSRIEPVSVPDFLLDRIKNKIETKQIVEKRNTNFLLAFALVLLIVNGGVLTTYSSDQDSKNTSQTINPYSISETIFTGYE
ncbi:MAG: hypothetical protein ABF242_07725 [Flavobacteriales bacterium]